MKFTLLLMTLFLFQVQVTLSAADLLPSKVIDLSSWKLTIPQESSKAGKPVEIL